MELGVACTCEEHDANKRSDDWALQGLARRRSRGLDGQLRHITRDTLAARLATELAMDG